MQKGTRPVDGRSGRSARRRAGVDSNDPYRAYWIQLKDSERALVEEERRAKGLSFSQYAADALLERTLEDRRSRMRQLKFAIESGQVEAPKGGMQKMSRDELEISLRYPRKS